MENLTEVSAQLSKPKKFIIAVLISYLFFYMFPFPAEFIPVMDTVLYFYTSTVSTLNTWIAHTLLGIQLPGDIGMTGSGDGISEYVKIFTHFLLAIAVGSVLFFFIKKEKNFNRLQNFVMIYARYYVGLFMVVYGFAKLGGGQFREPSVFQLEHTYGNSTPMNLLWTFMGYSKAYTWFSGIGELIAGVLLLFRRTTAIGCVLTIFIMVNVAMLNFCYDVPVKLFSSHLVFISLVILGPNIKGLFNLFFRKETTTIEIPKLELPKKWMRITRIVLKSLIILIIPLSLVFMILDMGEEEMSNENFSGTYKTEMFVLNKDTLQPLTTDTIRWNKMMIGSGYAKIQTMADAEVFYSVTFDTKNKKLQLSSEIDTIASISLNYKELPDNRFSLSGLYNEDIVDVIFKKKEIKDYPLIKRGFNWVNEYPVNQ